MKHLLFVPGGLRAASTFRAPIRANLAAPPDCVEAVVADIGATRLGDADIAVDPAVDAWDKADCDRRWGDLPVVRDKLAAVMRSPG